MEGAKFAFSLTVGAGGATCVGALFPFFFKITNFTFLAIALAFSAGVMTYVSFIEIFFKSKNAFIALNGEMHATLSAAGCFFGGMLFASLLDYLVHLLDPDHSHDPKEGSAPDLEKGKENDESLSSSLRPLVSEEADKASGFIELQEGSSHAPGGEEILPGPLALHPRSSSPSPSMTSSHPRQITTVPFLRHPITWIKQDWAGFEGLTHHHHHHDKKATARLRMTGILTALAISLHNFPEGLATFVGALADPKVGYVLAVAIGIHNIPEGICVAMPIYFSTGSRLKAFLWASISGFSEPLGAAIGWAIISIANSPIMFGILFGLVGGMMVYISMKELLPTAHRHDPNDRFVTWSFLAGMGVMALSLLLFEY